MSAQVLQVYSANQIARNAADRRAGRRWYGPHVTDALPAQGGSQSTMVGSQRGVDRYLRVHPPKDKYKPFAGVARQGESVTRQPNLAVLGGGGSDEMLRREAIRKGMDPKDAAGMKTEQLRDYMRKRLGGGLDAQPRIYPLGAKPLQGAPVDKVMNQVGATKPLPGTDLFLTEEYDDDAALFPTLDFIDYKFHYDHEGVGSAASKVTSGKEKAKGKDKGKEEMPEDNKIDWSDFTGHTDSSSTSRSITSSITSSSSTAHPLHQSAGDVSQGGVPSFAKSEAKPTRPVAQSAPAVYSRVDYDGKRVEREGDVLEWEMKAFAGGDADKLDLVFDDVLAYLERAKAVGVKGEMTAADKAFLDKKTAAVSKHSPPVGTQMLKTGHLLLRGVPEPRRPQRKRNPPKYSVGGK